MTAARPTRAAARLPRALSGVLGAALTLGTLAGGVVSASSAQASAGLTVTPTSTERITPGTTGSIAGMSISGDEVDTLQATVATDVGTITITPTGTDALAYGNAWTGTASVTFTGTQADINTALASATLAAPAGNGTAHVGLTAMVPQSGFTYLSSNQHFYKYVASAGSTWLQADAGAKTISFAGQRGYLATIADSTDNDFVSTKMSGATNVWFGARSYESGATDGTATEATVNGTTYARVWRWAEGSDESPIAGGVISECPNQVTVCAFADRASLYDSWASGEPNNYNIPNGAPAYSGEWAAVTNWNGTLRAWNDLPNSTTGISGYIVEFGGNINADPSLGTGFSGVVTATQSVTLAPAATAPSAPTITVTPGDNAATVSWNPPADGGSTITGYEYSTDGTNWSPLATTTSSTVVNGNVVTTVTGTVGGLVNGVQSSIQVRALNNVGNGTASAVSNVTPYTVPDPPTPLTVVPGNFSITVTWAANSDGGRPVSGYTAEAGGHSCTSTGTTCTITGLADGTAYSVDVYATNVAGSGSTATWLALVTPAAPDLTPSGPVTSNQPQHATAPFPAGGSVALLDTQWDSVTTVTFAGQGTYTINTTTGVITFTPVLGFVGTPDPVLYLTSDGNGHTGTGSFAPAAVTAPDGPTATPLTPSSPPDTNQPQHATTSIPSGGSATLLDAQGNPATTVTVDGEGTYTILAGALTFTPLIGFVGTPTSVDYRLTDAYGQSSDSTFSPGAVTAPAGPSAAALTPSSPPVTNQPQHATTSIPSGGSASLLDADGNPATTVTVDGQGTYTISGGTITFTPELGYVGTPDPVGYRLTDAYGHTGDSTFAPGEVTAPAAPTAPALTPTGLVVDNQPQHATVSIPTQGSATLLDGNGDPATTVVVDGEGTYVLNPATGVITFTPVLGFTGSPTPVDYRVTDAYGQSTDSTFTPNTVTAPTLATPPVLAPDAPVVSNQPQHTTATIPSQGSIVLIDGDGDPATTVVVPGQGTFVLDPATGEIVFTPAVGFTGTPDPVTYELTDAYGQLAASTFAPAAVTPPDGPTAPPAPSGGSGAGGHPQEFPITVPSGDSISLVDGNGDPATTVVVDGVGTYSVDPSTGVVTFTPDPGYHGTPAPATYVITDPYGQTATGTVAPSTVTIAPSAPTITQVAIGDGKVTLTISAPLSDGGDAVTGYTIVVEPTGQRITVTGSGPVTIDGLTNGVPYTFTVVATNAVGTSPVSSAAAATPVASGAPGLKNPGTGNHKLAVTVVPPSSTGTPIVGYVVTLSPGGATQHLSGAAGGQVVFTGLVNGQPYTATVQAQYATVAGPTGASLVLTPMTVPSAPKFHVRRTPTKLVLKLVAPKNNGGATVKSYRVIVSGPGLKKAKTFTLAAKKKTLTVYSLRPATRYKVAVTALNAAGQSKGFKAYVRTKKAPKAGLSVGDVAGHPIASGVTVNIFADAAFASSSAVMTPRTTRLLTVLAKAGKGHKAITCAGYSFGGVPAQDFALALSRAHAVCAFLKAHHAAVRTTVVSYGGTRPLVTKGTQKSRASNRRVTITFA